MQKFMHLRRQVLNLALSGQLESVGTDLNQQGPFAIPAHWHWQPLKELGTLVMGHTPKSTVPEFWEPATIVWVTPSDLTAHHEIYLSNSARKISPQGCTHSRTSLVPVGTVLYTTRATIGAIAIAACECCTNQGCISFIPDDSQIESLWAYYTLMQATPYIISLSEGSTFREVSKAKLGQVQIPVPPLSEQRKICTQLTQLLSQIRLMEEAYADLSGPVAKRWRSLVLQQAITGMLVTQSTDDGAVVPRGPQLDSNAVPFVLPPSWHWLRLDQITKQVHDGEHRMPPNSGSGIPVIEIKHLDQSSGQVCFDHIERWCEPAALARFGNKIVIEPSDVLLSVVGSIGKTAQVSTECQFLLSRSIAIIKPEPSVLDSNYLRVALNAPFIQRWLYTHARGTKHKNVALGTLRQMYIPVPPLAEQRRIAARIKELMAQIANFSALEPLLGKEVHWLAP